MNVSHKVFTHIIQLRNAKLYLVGEKTNINDEKVQVTREIASIDDVPKINQKDFIKKYKPKMTLGLSE